VAGAESRFAHESAPNGPMADNPGAESSRTRDEYGARGPIGRVLRVFVTLLNVHIRYAQREAANDRDRLITGAAMAAAGVLFVSMMLVLLQGAAVVALHTHRLSWVLSILSVAGADLVLGALLFAAARSRFRRPVLPETRKLVVQTFDSMVN